jgi:Fe-S cluster assembly scaffold protein SufB
MMDLEYFLENYSMTGFHPYVVVNDNTGVNVEVNEKDYEIWDVNSKKGQEYIEKYETQENTFGEYTGYVIVVKKGANIPIQTCFLTSQKDFVQNVQNLIVVEDGGECEIFTGCLSNAHVNGNVHNAITDIYVGKNAKLTFNMVHSWGETSSVFPKTKIFVDEGGVFLSNYIVWDKVKKIVMNPKIYLAKNAKAVSQALIYSHDGSDFSIGGTVELNGSSSSGEIISSIVSEGGDYKNISEIVGRESDTKGHVECNAILVGNGTVEAVPILKALNPSTQLTHEASVGKISSSEVEYLQTKGLSKDMARELIVKGFVNKSLKNMPDLVQKKMLDIVDGVKDGF